MYDSEKIKDILSEVHGILAEGGNHNPFQNKKNLGPSIRGGTNKQKRRWECSGEGYQQTCVGIAEDNKDRVITINIDPDWKKVYNEEYKADPRNKARRRRLDKKKRRADVTEKKVPRRRDSK